MKKILFASICLLFILQSCYDDYVFDYEYTATYFTYQYPLRTLLVEDDKDLAFDFGVVLGGKRENTKNETVEYRINPSLLDEYPQLKLLPSDHYTLSDDSQITIPPGEVTGRITVTIDKDWFLTDPDAVNPVYALPVEIVSTTADSILAEKEFSIIVVKYYNEYQGLYWLNGVDTTFNFVGDTPEEVTVYSKTDDAVIRGFKKLMLTTSGKTTIKAEYTGKEAVGNYSMHLDIRKDDGLVVITPDPLSPVTELSGTGYYDVRDKAMYLNYMYLNNGIKHTVADTLLYLDTPMSFQQWKE